MDDSRFDAWTRAAASVPTRRALLGAALGGLAAALIGGRVDAADKRALGGICRKNGDCASGVCGRKDRTGRQYCVCATGADCPALSEPCAAATCVDGVCGTGGFKAAGTVCRASTHLCDPTTVCSGTSADCPYDPLELEGRICYGGVIGDYPTPPPVPNPCDVVNLTICENNVCDDSVIYRCSPPPPR
ncbi:MAG: hypothetical protein IT336_10500 [Thermomicrobiales bacterium]|nr:hypothetical protein [Thermomicrobiales bacterium]